jgi:hypothetical protein
VCSHKLSQVKKRVLPQHVSPSIPCALAMAALPPAAAEAAVAEAATGGEAMVVEIIAETEAAVRVYNNQP